RSIVNHIDTLVTLRLMEVVRSCRTLMAVSGSNTEVGNLSGGTQRRHEVVCTSASDGSPFLCQAGVRVSRANLGQGSLVRNWHLCLRYSTVKRSDNASYQCITNQR